MSFSRLSLLSLLTNTLPGPSASEVTTLWRYTNVFIVIIIIKFTCLAVLFDNLSPGLPLGLGPSTSYSMHFFTQSSFRSTCSYHRSLFCSSTNVMSSVCNLCISAIKRWPFSGDLRSFEIRFESAVTIRFESTVRRAGVLTCGSCHLERSARPHPHRGWSCQVPKTAEITLF